MKEKLDAIDRAILRVLQGNAKTPFKYFVQTFYRSFGNISARIKRLFAEGFIISFRAQLDPAKLGIHCIGYVRLHLLQQSGMTLEKFKTELDKIDGVCSCVSITGQASHQVKIAVENVIRFNHIADTIASITNVTITETYLALEEIIPDKGYHF